MKISPEMRAMIDAALAAGNVQVVPPRSTALHRHPIETVSAMPDPAVRKKRGPKRKGPSVESVDEKRARRVKNGLAKVQETRDRRRFKAAPVPTGEMSRLAPDSATGTIFPNRVQEAGLIDNVLVDGASNSKIGGGVLKGRLKGAHIVTLTLEERATCPRSCPIWRGCYGNNLSLSTRWNAGKALENRLRAQVAELCAKHQHVLVRLHITGDFYSHDYLCLWADLLDCHDNLTAFGFTAHEPKGRMGSDIAKLRDVYPDRFMIRHSGRGGEWGSFTIDYPTETPRLGDAIVCPEQFEAMNGKTGRHCGNCALCWQSSVPIVFVEH